MILNFFKYITVYHCMVTQLFFYNENSYLQVKVYLGNLNHITRDDPGPPTSLRWPRPIPPQRRLLLLLLPFSHSLLAPPLPLHIVIIAVSITWSFASASTHVCLSPSIFSETVGTVVGRRHGAINVGFLVVLVSGRSGLVRGWYHLDSGRVPLERHCGVVRCLH